MPWIQVYDPLGHAVLSTLIAALPIVLLLTTLALAAFGLVMVASSSIAVSEGLGVGPFHFVVRHVVFLAGGMLLALAIARSELKFIEKHSRLLLLSGFVLLAASRNACGRPRSSPCRMPRPPVISRRLSRGPRPGSRRRRSSASSAWLRTHALPQRGPCR